MRATNLAMLVVLSTLGCLQIGCGGEGAECGPGTVEEDGTCVVADGDVDDSADDDANLPDDDGAGDDLDGSDDAAQPEGMDMDGDGDIDHEGTDMDGDDVGDPAGDPAGGDDPGGDADGNDNGGMPGLGEAQACDAPEACAELSRQVFDAVSAARAAAGACGGAALAWCDGCAASAAGHSAAMSAANGMTSGDGTLGARLDAQSVGWSAVGEVYGRARGTPAELVENWMAASAGEYLRSCEYSMAGVGAAPSTTAGAAAWVTVTLISP
ncbi:MAG: hypothetical protein HYY06_18730 [Deltaproteobacteria bacterium]|nr:hypothetical protein [Deltaproteobacteria bacterium]